MDAPTPKDEANPKYTVRIWVCGVQTVAVTAFICVQIWSDLSSEFKFRELDFLHLTGFQNRSYKPPSGKDLCAIGHRNVSRQLQENKLRERDLLSLAQDAAKQPLPPGKPTIAFLFLVRGEIPHENLWRRFFDNHDDMYSIYVHAKPGFKFPVESFFSCREIPSKPVKRFSFSMVDAMRRMIAHALLDTAVPNAWFVFACESSIPVRSFPFVYSYLINSNVSFVESFRPVRDYYTWNTLPEFPRNKLRKGELWMALQRKHAGMVVAEATLYRKFRRSCRRMCTPDEQYMQTLLAMKDPRGIANRTVMYVDWSHKHGGSPFLYTKGMVGAKLIRKIQERVVDVDGARHDTAAMEERKSRLRECRHNGVRGSPCFLFARKFSKCTSSALQKLSREVFGF